MNKKKWSDLPSELLPCIAERLGLIELLCFRGVCKDWNSASETASAEVESLPDHEPWFLLYGGGENSQCHLVTDSGKKYALDIPELSETTTCIASNNGWLLLLQEGSTMLFFCPFSRTKIELPQLPQSNLSYHVAALSSPPTSEDCTVAVIGHDDELKLELYLLQRGANAWTRYVPHASYDTSKIKCAACHKGTFYFFKNKDKLITFSLHGTEWNSYQIVSPSSPGPVERTLPFIQAKQEFKRRNMNKLLGLEEDVSVSICGTISRHETYDEVVFNEMIEVAAADREEDKIRNLKGVWIQPRFFKISPELSW
ncbi:hypothetical protein HS088_TW17G00238 [Tripterygium wilfordii]|uniref:F-box domain-containing protein n=1 Tax=Tripterygium wilfordii TaxID=458696 RepID=A0A7J7CEZ0_TRIWF|nr:F-box/kelch-repeat protein At1g57790-like [Tripterygium wilfordii]XP_038682547.1 F-box/kelch-repeat protein At1g57790-like [Tripterygium wilfordii]KAF5732708.1 hypothetical protein HS088_TW17G00238 [Tripterygium wilfordii]